MMPPPLVPAPYSVRLRLAATGLAIAWIIAGVFLLLGWRAQNGGASVSAAATATRLR